MANKEHLSILKQGVKVWNSWREENAGIRPDLRKADLRAADLRGANLNAALLEYANFSRADLREADLSQTVLLVANLSGANLSGANLRNAYLYNAYLYDAFLYEADLSEANLLGVDLSGLNLRGANLSHANLQGTNLHDADLYEADLSHADLHEADLSHTDLRGANLVAVLTLANLRGANLRGANLRGAFLHGANLTGANLTGANLIEAYLLNADLSGADLSGADLSEAKVAPEQLEQAFSLEGAIMPDGTKEEAKRQIEATERELRDRKQELVALPPSPVPVARPAEPEEEQLAPGRLPFEPEMILIPAGEFLMGSDPGKDKDAQGDEQPQHTLYLPDYTIAKTPVTNAQYAEFVRDAGLVEPPRDWRGDKPPRDRLNHPVVPVGLHDAVAYCTWLADITGKPYRLPSEAEWEKAARGTDGRIYPWGNRWYPKWCNTSESGKGDTTPVGRYPRGASPYAVLDMAGNLWEGTRSLWGRNWREPDFKYPYDPTDGRENLGAGDDVLRVLRGGSFNFNRHDARCAYRYYGHPGYRADYFGFRVVVSPSLS